VIEPTLRSAKTGNAGDLEVEIPSKPVPPRSPTESHMRSHLDGDVGRSGILSNPATFHLLPE
jgi:hypothetical protein